ncbi:MAG: restriction endonuclease subunit S [Phycisphaerae bacterium]
MAKRRAKSERSETTEAPLVPAELPAGWAVATLGDDLVVEITPGFACGAHSRDTADVSHLRPMNVNSDGRIDLGNVKYVPAPAAIKANKWLERGDVLFNNTNSAELVGKTAYYDRDERLAFSNHMTRVRVRTDGLDPRYCAFYLHANWRAGDFQARCNQHVSQASIGREVLLDTPIPVPPLVEQKRIADRIEALLKSVDAGRERLAKLPNILRLFRQSILAAACSGRLTEDWRDAHPDTEPSTNALARFDRDAAKHNGSDRRPAESTLDFELMPELPETWCYRRADSIVAPKTVITYGIVLPGPETPDGVPYVRQQDIQDGKVLIDQLRRTTGAIAAKHDRSRLHKGDVLLCIIRHLRVAVVPPGLDGANLTQGTVRMRPSAVMVGEFLALLLASPHTQSWMKQRHFGMSMPRINVEHAREIPVAVPPVTEQVEIVRRVRSLMNLAESIERRLAVAQVRTDKLTQAILARAYCGELVETEAELARAECRDYESGEALLARIQAKSDASHDARPARRPRVSRQPIVAATAAAPAYGSPPKRTHIPSAAQVSMEKP